MSSLSHPKYRADIDGLRSIAVLAVVIFHAFPSLLPGGFVGVDIFFIISGYLISTIIFNNVNTSSFSFVDFYIRRANRIFPSLVLVLLACWVFGWFSLYSDEFAHLGKLMAGGAGFVANIVLLFESGYFDAASETKILLHLWSLGIEEQFYLIWPVLLIAAKRLKFNFLYVTLFCILISFIYSVKTLPADPTLAFYSPLSRFWELLLGALLAWITINQKKISRGEINKGYALQHAASFSGVALIALSLIFVSKNNFPGVMAIGPTIGAILIIGSGPFAYFNRYVLSSRPLVFIGIISYPLYLWHWPIFTYLRVINGSEPTWLVMSAAILASIVLSVATYYLWEKPIRFSNKKGLTAIILTLSVAIIGFSGYYTFTSKGIPSRSTVENAKLINSQFVGAEWKFSKNDICLNRYPFEDANNYKWWFCMQNEDKSPDVLILGTSFANHLFPGMVDNDPEHKTFLSIGTCDPFLDEKQSEWMPAIHPCYGSRAGDQFRFINKVIENNKSIHTVVIDGLSVNPDKEYLNRIGSYVKHLSDMDIKTIIFIPHARPGFNTKACFARPFKEPTNSCVVDANEHNKTVKAYETFAHELRKQSPSTVFFDQSKAYCDGKECHFIKNSLPLFRDEGHYSFYGSDLIGKEFYNFIRKQN
ncbi:acyltransferase family protein [Escherichia coli]